MEIERREFGRTGIQLSIIGFGAATLGGEYGENDIHDGRRAVHAAIDAGINILMSLLFTGAPLPKRDWGWRWSERGIRFFFQASARAFV